MKKMKVVRITKEEYELDDGTVITHVSKLDEVPSLEEFQSYLDEWYEKLVTPYEERNEG
jgi:hypothetical protein